MSWMTGDPGPSSGHRTCPVHPGDHTAAAFLGMKHPQKRRTQFRRFETRWRKGTWNLEMSRVVAVKTAVLGETVSCLSWIWSCSQRAAEEGRLLGNVFRALCLTDLVTKRYHDAF